MGCAPTAISRNTVPPVAASSLVATDTLDNDFRSFVRHRDPAALAAVFDAAAPRLLLVAMHLTRDSASAELASGG